MMQAAETILPPISTPTATRVTVAPGDGIGPEITAAVLRVLDAAGANLSVEPIAIGMQAAERGATSGIHPDAWSSVRRTRVLLKGPLTTPEGGGVKSVNVTLRKTLGLFANVRPCVAYAPFVPTRYPGMDVVVIRENEEDLYAGIEHRQTDDVVQCLKIMSVPGTERIVRYAFEYARAAGRRKVTCMTKDNIMKMTDGLFRRTFERIGEEYPELEREHLIVDIGAARLATRPELFDVLVLPNLYGDILSDVAAEMAGSVGMAGSANIGTDIAMFEAIHGSAPLLAGRGIANPSGLLLAAVQMMVHVGKSDVASLVHNAWLRTIEDGVHTPDVFGRGGSTREVGTEAFAEAVVERLGEWPRQLSRMSYAEGARGVDVAQWAPARASAPAVKALIGVDVFVCARETQPEQLAAQVQQYVGAEFSLEMITNRGVKVWPNGFPETCCTDHWRCRLLAAPGRVPMDGRVVAELLARLASGGVEFVKTEHLYSFDGKPGFSLGQGQ